MLRYIVFVLILSSHLCAQGYRNEDECCWYNKLEIGADWIYWEASQEEMDIAAEILNSGTTVNATPIYPDFSYHSGYKVYLTYDLSCDWSFYAGLTHLPSIATLSAFVSPAEALAGTATIGMNSESFPIFLVINDSTGQVINSMDTSWNLNLYYLDLNIERSFFSSRWLEMGPYFGLRGMWMKQTLEVDAITPNFGGTPGIIAFFSLEQQEKIRGVGLQGGMHGYYRMGCGFSLMGQFGGSLLYSRMNMDGDFVVDNPIGTVPTNFDFFDFVLYKSITTIDTSILLQYATCLCGHGVELHMGWENHVFFHTNFFGVSESGSLTMQGLTLGGSFRF